MLSGTIRDWQINKPPRGVLSLSFLPHLARHVRGAWRDWEVVEEDVPLGFWFAWAIDALISAIALFFFFVGLADGSVSSFNIGIWITLLTALAVMLSGGLWLRAVGRPGLATMVLLVLAIPGVLYALFLLVAIISGSRWN